MPRTCEKASISVFANCNDKPCQQSRRKRACEGSCVRSSQAGDETTGGPASQVGMTDLAKIDKHVCLSLLINTI